MENSKAGANLKRRGFLLAGSAGAAGAVATAVVPALSSKVAAPAAPAVAATGAGYQNSEHVRTYYDLARV